MASVDEFLEAPLLVADAWDYILDPPRIYLVRPVRIRKERPPQHDHVALAALERPFSYIGIAQFPHCNNGNLLPGVGLDILIFKIFFYEIRHFNEASGGHCVRGWGSHQLS